MRGTEQKALEAEWGEEVRAGGDPSRSGGSAGLLAPFMQPGALGAWVFHFCVGWRSSHTER